MGKGGRKKNDRVVFPESVPICFKILFVSNLILWIPFVLCLRCGNLTFYSYPLCFLFLFCFVI